MTMKCRESPVCELVLDTEFNDETAGDSRIDLISIGMVSVADENRSVYAVSSEFNRKAAESRGFLLTEVLPKLGQPPTHLPRSSIHALVAGFLQSEIRTVMALSPKAADSPDHPPAPPVGPLVRIWAKSGAMDHASLCLLFGGMGKFLGFIRQAGARTAHFLDTNELRRQAGFPYLKDTRPDWDCHHALKDAVHERSEMLILREIIKGLADGNKPHPGF